MRAPGSIPSGLRELENYAKTENNSPIVELSRLTPLAHAGIEPWSSSLDGT